MGAFCVLMLVLITSASVFHIADAFSIKLSSSKDKTTTVKPELITAKASPSLLKKFRLEKQKKLTWLAAAQHCQDQGKQLAVISTPDEQQAFKEMLDKAREATVWIGGQCEDDSICHWNSGTDRVPIGNYTHWQPGQPDTMGGEWHCITASSDPSREWWLWDCQAAKSFVCHSY